LVLRLVAGLPLLFFGILHFIKLTAFAEILIASGLPFVEFNKFAAPTLEVLAGLFLIPGFLSRLGGLLAVLTMGPAIYGTFAIHALTSDHLPSGLETIPQVPPLAVPIVILLIGVLLAFYGGGGLSLDRKLSTRHDC
jgi:uncharacterized membrane protein YphA (DoxX/SURF4 family)